jgi:hypothetical protein
MNEKTANALIAGTVKDSILLRLAVHAPVENGYDVLILAYTRQLFSGLDTFVQAHAIDFDMDSIRTQLEIAEAFAREAGYVIPTL